MKISARLASAITKAAQSAGWIGEGKPMIYAERLIRDYRAAGFDVRETTLEDDWK